MTLYEFLKMTGDDYDVYDTEYDISVTCCDCHEYENKDNYYRFCVGITKLVTVEKLKNGNITANWCDLIRTNMKVFKDFTKKNWYRDYEDEDDFIYEWINEIHYWGAGYTDEDTYKDFVENYMSKMKGV